MDKLKRSIKNENGMAVIEAIPLLVIFIVLISFGLGLYGVVQTATLQSIAARTFAFDTFRNRTNLNFFREDGSGLDHPLYLGKKGYRFHAITSDTDTTNDFMATTRRITFGTEAKQAPADGPTHNQSIFNLESRNQKVSVNPVWVMVGYGLCLDADCGG